jgi:cytochrome o ubiquinol oxidase operon protein cyoD
MSMDADAHGHDDHGETAGHGTLKSYLTGFGLAVVLTVIPFWLVMSGVIGSALATGIIVMVLAIVQIVVHMFYFLHVNRRAEGGWNMLALIFTLIILVIVVSGSLWVMYNLDANMMPQQMPPGMAVPGMTESMPQG